MTDNLSKHSIRGLPAEDIKGAFAITKVVGYQAWLQVWFSNGNNLDWLSDTVKIIYMNNGVDFQLWDIG